MTLNACAARVAPRYEDTPLTDVRSSPSDDARTSDAFDARAPDARADDVAGDAHVEDVAADHGATDDTPDVLDGTDTPDVPDALDVPAALDAPDALDVLDAPDAFVFDVPRDVPGPCDAATCPRVRGLALGHGSTFAVYGDGRVACWGRNSNGQLGLGDTVSVARAVLNPFLSDVVHMGAGTMHACALLRDGSISCWGNNDSGVASPTSAPTLYAPRRYAGVEGVAQLAVGWMHNCVLQPGGVVRCWGDSSTGEPGTAGSPRTPTLVSLPAAAVRLWARGATTCAELTTGAVACWGRNDSGQFGDGTMVAAVSSRSFVRGLSNPRAFALGGVHACAIDSGWRVSCWGSNRCASLGDPPGDSLLPRAVPGVTGASLVSLGHVHSCVFRAGMGVACWGSATACRSAPSIADWGATPTLIAGTASTDVLESGWNHVCVVMNGYRDVACWGHNDGGALGGTPMAGETIVRVVLPP